jgi:hypothetical protein
MNLITVKEAAEKWSVTPRRVQGLCKEGSEIKTPKKPLGAGAIIATALGTLVLFGGGAFSLIWFVIRKKIK